MCVPQMDYITTSTSNLPWYSKNILSDYILGYLGLHTQCCYIYVISSVRLYKVLSQGV